jgi:hypothetical protein
MSLTAGGWNGEKILMRQVDMPQIPFTITQFPLYEHFKKVLARRFPSEKGDGQATAVHSALAGSIGGGVASLVTQPVDVVRTRIMLEAKVRSHCLFLGRVLAVFKLMMDTLI